jgi:hypothetical protein
LIVKCEVGLDGVKRLQICDLNVFVGLLFGSGLDFNLLNRLDFFLFGILHFLFYFCQLLLVQLLHLSGRLVGRHWHDLGRKVQRRVAVRVDFAGNYDVLELDWQVVWAPSLV